jgi:tetratricopeptide (TPR) repeat protein
MSEYGAAIPDLEYEVEKDPKFDYYRATGLLGDAYARTGDLKKTGAYFAPAAQHSTTPETLYNYANFLKLSGKKVEAVEYLQKLAAKKKTLPTYMRRTARPWFNKGKVLHKHWLSKIGSGTSYMASSKEALWGIRGGWCKPCIKTFSTLGECFAKALC